MTKTKEVNIETCQRCGHDWQPKVYTETEKPIICPKCKSPYWNRSRLH